MISVQILFLSEKCMKLGSSSKIILLDDKYCRSNCNLSYQQIRCFDKEYTGSHLSTIVGCSQFADIYIISGVPLTGLVVFLLSLEAWKHPRVGSLINSINCIIVRCIDVSC